MTKLLITRHKRIGLFAGIMLLLVIAVRLLAPRVSYWLPARWQATASGLEVGITAGRVTTGRVRVTAVRAAPGCVVRVVDAHRGKTYQGALAREVCPPDGAAINANFFDIETLTPIGVVVSDGVVRSGYFAKPCYWGRWGCFAVRDGQPVIGAASPTGHRGSSQAVQCAPWLVRDGRLLPVPRRPAASRAAIGIDGRGRLVLAVCEGDITLEAWGRCLRSQLGCVDVLNLDGGPSAQLAVRGSRPVAIDHGKPVPILLTVCGENQGGRDSVEPTPGVR